jgi:hypothetical protein
MIRLAAPLLLEGGTAVIFGKAKRDPKKEAEADSVAEEVGMQRVTVHRTEPVGMGARSLYVYEKVARTPPRHERKASQRSGRNARMRARPAVLAEAQRKNAERLTEARRRVEKLEVSGADDPSAVEELEQARAVVHKLERRIELLAERQTRAARKAATAGRSSP